MGIPERPKNTRVRQKQELMDGWIKNTLSRSKNILTVVKKVVRKWLNLKTRVDEFHSDYSSAASQDRLEKGLKASRTCLSADFFPLPKSADTTAGEGAAGGPENAKQLAFDSHATTSSNKLNLRVFVGTWNVGGKVPGDSLDLEEWLLESIPPAEIYVLGFQEIVPLNASNVLGAEDDNPAAKWLSLIREKLNSSKDDQSIFYTIKNITDESNKIDRTQSGRAKICSSEMMFLDENCEITLQSPTLYRNSSHSGEPKYCLAVSKQMVGLLLCVWVRTEIFQHVSNLKVSCVGRGIMGYMGNKGSVSISMTLYETSFCFICTHLASGEKEENKVRRNADVMEILKRTSFSTSRKHSGKIFAPKRILDHDCIVWLGDLNYRLATGFDDSGELLKNHDWDSLLQRDQLQVELRAGGVFEGWEEGKITFPPTYKYLINSDRYANENCDPKQKNSCPAWCDRILWRGKGMEQIAYVRSELRFSDHRPVYSLFTLEIESPNTTPALEGQLQQYNSSVRSPNWLSNVFDIDDDLEPETHLW